MCVFLNISSTQSIMNFGIHYFSPHLYASIYYYYVISWVLWIYIYIERARVSVYVCGSFFLSFFQFLQCICTACSHIDVFCIVYSLLTAVFFRSIQIVPAVIGFNVCRTKSTISTSIYHAKLHKQHICVCVVEKSTHLIANKIMICFSCTWGHINIYFSMKWTAVFVKIYLH